MKPMARIKIVLTRTYEKTCSEEKPKVEATPCDTSSWGDWSECSVKCGDGKKRRVRVYIDPKKAVNMGCLQLLSEVVSCTGEDPYCDNNRSQMDIGSHRPSKKVYNQIAECALTEWTPWSKCSNDCGRGYRTRSRYYRVSTAQERCERGVVIPPRLVEREDCTNSIGCIGDVDHGRSESHTKDSSNCPTTMWTPWSPCSVSCGYGQQIRSRSLKRKIFASPNPEECDHIELQEVQICGQYNPPCNSYGGGSQLANFCLLPPDSGTCRHFKNKWFYNPITNDCGIFSYSNCGGNENRFDSLDACLEKCRITNHQHQIGMGYA